MQSRLLRRVWSAVLVIGATAGATSPSIVVLSGGGSPTTNRYSQYLQTKTLYDFVVQKEGSAKVKIFYGSGNNPQTAQPLPDVYRLEPLKDYPQLRASTFIPGTIDGNTKASKANVLQFFKNAAQSPEPQDSFLFLVSDHGMPNYDKPDYEQNPHSDNCIETWGVGDVDYDHQKIPKQKFSDKCLAMRDLDPRLRAIPAKKRIFVMTQCYSGGFHLMAVKPGPEGLPTSDGSVCGFTATDAANVASGCTADADDDRYKGYERFMTEQMSGVDVVSGKRLRAPKLNLLEAHRAAVLEDLTLDIPLTSADFYLFVWTKAIRDAKVRELVQKRTTDKALIVDEFNSALNGPIESSEDSAVRDYSSFVTEMTKQIAKKYPSFSALLREDFSQVYAKLRSDLESLTEQLTKKQEQINADLDQAREKFNSAITESVVDRAFTPEEQDAYKNYREFTGRSEGDGLQALLTMRLFYPELYGLARVMAASNFTRLKSVMALDPDANPYVNRLNELVAQSDELDYQHEALNAQSKLLSRIYYYRLALAGLRVIYARKDAKSLEDLSRLNNCLNTSL